MASIEIGKGVSERLVYGAIIAATAKLVEKGYMTPDMQIYVAGGGVAALGSIYAWWRNRPGALMDRAAAQLPDSSHLVITTPPEASMQDKDTARQLASASGDRVTAKSTF